MRGLVVPSLLAPCPFRSEQKKPAQFQSRTMTNLRIRSWRDTKDDIFFLFRRFIPNQLIPSDSCRNAGGWPIIPWLTSDWSAKRFSRYSFGGGWCSETDFIFHKIYLEPIRSQLEDANCENIKNYLRWFLKFSAQQYQTFWNFSKHKGIKLAIQTIEALFSILP